MSAGGGKEIHFDSSAIRAQYDQGGGVPVTDAAYVPPIAETPIQVGPQQLAETLPKDVLEAMAKGVPPNPESLRKMAASLPAATAAAHQAAPQMFNRTEQSVTELTIPVGRGVTARVTFNAQPTQQNWRRLIRHLEIEADPENDEGPEPVDLARLAEEALARHNHEVDLRAGREATISRPDNGASEQPLRAGNGSSESVVPRPAKRRKRKDDRSTPELD